MHNIWLLLLIFIVSLVIKNSLLVVASAIVIIMELLQFKQVMLMIDRKGIQIGLLFLTVTALIPLARGITPKQALHSFTTTTGLFAIIGGILGAYLNAQGISLIQLKPEIVPGIIVGMIICVIFFGGVPVGPVMAAGFTAILIALFGS